MAQAGMFVPCSSAKIGIIDRIFSRVGASDDLARGRSTFMVEMVETAAILLRATERSFVILDEIGRGTATFDGLAIAWASLEALAQKNKCRTLFATHYHELTALADKIETLSLHTMKTKEWQESIVFLYEIIDGSADRSYGIHVAKLAGMPPAVITRAKQVLSELESKKAKIDKLLGDLPLFAKMEEDAQAALAKSNRNECEAVRLLKELKPDEMSPKEALETLYRLQKAVEKDE
jgi:DNA mismatch repair protein MutS